MSEQYEELVLKALRRITRAIDLHSRQLANTYGLTGPQLICLKTIGKNESITLGTLANKVSLSQATITGIIDRLETRQLVQRERSTKDRRVITIILTEAGQKLIKQAPNPLQETFSLRFSNLTIQEKKQILENLEKIIELMDSSSIKAAPVLSTSPTIMSPEETQNTDDIKPGDVVPVATIDTLKVFDTD